MWASGSVRGLILSLTSKYGLFKAGFGPFPPEIYHVPFPCHCASLDETEHAMEQLFKCDIEPSRVAAIVFEPVQGEGGFNVIQAEALQWLRALCDQHGILMIADEVQTGFARTGKMFAMEHFGISPDLMTMAKSMAGGFPISAVIGTPPSLTEPVAGAPAAAEPAPDAAAAVASDPVEAAVAGPVRTALASWRSRTAAASSCCPAWCSWPSAVPTSASSCASD